MINKSSAFLWSDHKPHAVKEKLMHQERKAKFYQLTDEEVLSLYTDRLVDSELLYGEIVDTKETSGAYTKIVVPDQKSSKDQAGYPGWVFTNDLSPIPEDWSAELDKAAIKKSTAQLNFFDMAYEKQEISVGTVFSVTEADEKNIYVLTPDGPGWIAKEAVQFLGQSSQDSAEQIISLAKEFLHLRYVWAGTSVVGFDCSGFVYSLYRVFGRELSRDAHEQALEGTEVHYSTAQLGDLLFFAYEEGKGAVHHVGIYIGDDQMIHSQTPGSKVIITTISGTNYAKELCTVRRHF
ncbi:C40 family peptidase [Carnobacterium sp. CS13]|uniref:C40 family peptidase n=1 Tax=Carnobacterium sp. CS13 TaxID=2800128 RepID=UPI001F3D660A|nr:C40 family peptidase [Carnobacterium sp. CS13]